MKTKTNLTLIVLIFQVLLSSISVPLVHGIGVPRIGPPLPPESPILLNGNISCGTGYQETVILSWSDNTAAILHPVYRIYRMETGGQYILLGSVDHGTWQWVDNTVNLPKVSYTYKIVSVWNTTENGSSNEYSTMQTPVTITQDTETDFNTNGATFSGTTVRNTGNDAVVVLSDSLNGIYVHQVAAGYQYSLALINDTVWAWGDNSQGQLGKGIAGGYSSIPNQVQASANIKLPTPILQTVSNLAAGGSHALALLSDGSVASWGNNGSGQLGRTGDATIGNYVVDGSGSLLGNITAISAGSNHSLALTGSGTVLAWGDNTYGQLGYTTTGSSSLIPSEVTLSDGVTPLSNIISIGTGNTVSYAIDTSGSVWAWGDNTYGELGNGTSGTTRNYADYVYNARTGGAKNTAFTAMKVTGGDGYSLALKKDGTVYAWGDNHAGLLGVDPSTPPSPIPGGFNPLSPWQVNFDFKDFPGKTMMVTDISAGDSHALATVREVKTVMPSYVYGWGQNSVGQLGNGTTTDTFVPTLITPFPLLPDAPQVAAGGRHSLAVGNPVEFIFSQKIYAWGLMEQGQLGNGIWVGPRGGTERYNPNPARTLLGNFPASGTYTSPVLDAGAASNWGDLNYEYTDVETIAIKVRTGSTPDMHDAPAWSTLTPIANGAPLSTGNGVTNGHRYVQYEATLSTSNALITPVLNKVTLSLFQNSSSCTMHTIRTSAESCGIVTPNNPLIPTGQNGLVQIIPTNGCRIKEVYVDGNALGNIGSYDFNNIDINHTVYAVFEKIPSQGGGGGSLPSQLPDSTGILSPQPSSSNGNGNQNTNSSLSTSNEDNLHSSAPVTGTGSTAEFTPPYFTDTENNWAKHYIDLLHEKCGIVGYTDKDGNPLHLFGPDQLASRAELVKILLQCQMLGGEMANKKPFPDAPLNTWYTPYLTKAKGLGWIEGYMDHTFKPLRTVNQAEALKIILLSEFSKDSLQTNSLSDLFQGTWFQKYMLYSMAKKYVEENTTPDRLMTRADIAKLIVLIKGW